MWSFLCGLVLRGKEQSLTSTTYGYVIEKREREMFDIGVAAALPLFDPLAEEARAMAFSKPGSGQVKRNFYGTTGGEIDLGGTGTAKASYSVDRGFWSGLHKLSLDRDNDGVMDADCVVTERGGSLGRVSKMEADYDKDSKTDVVFSINRPFWGKPTIEVDTNLDGKVDARLIPDYSTFGSLSEIGVDFGDDGIKDGTIKLNRSFGGDVKTITYEK